MQFSSSKPEIQSLSPSHFPSIEIISPSPQGKYKDISTPVIYVVLFESGVLIVPKNIQNKDVSTCEEIKLFVMLNPEHYVQKFKALGKREYLMIIGDHFVSSAYKHML